MLNNARTTPITTATLIKIDGLNLLLPQGDIRSLELVNDMDIAAPALHSAGWISYANKHWPVYCLSHNLSLMDSVPTTRRACAMLALGAGFIGILCDDMLVLKNIAAQPQPLPPAMHQPESPIHPATPIRYLVAYEQGIACLTDATSFASYVEQLVAKTSTPKKTQNDRP